MKTRMVRMPTNGEPVWVNSDRVFAVGVPLDNKGQVVLGYAVLTLPHDKLVVRMSPQDSVDALQGPAHLVRLSSPLGHMWVNTEYVFAVEPVVEKGAVIVGASLVTLPFGKVVVSESPEDVCRVIGSVPLGMVGHVTSGKVGN